MLALSVMFHQKAEQVGLDVLYLPYGFISLYYMMIRYFFYFLAIQKPTKLDGLLYLLEDLVVICCCFFQYIESVPTWVENCKISTLPSDILTLEASIHHHQSLYETMCQAYTEVRQTGGSTCCMNKLQK